MKYNPYFLDDVNKSADRKLFTYITTFAGAGGSSTGYKLAGGDCLLFNEFVQDAVDTYLANFPETKSLVGDIKKQTPANFLDAAGIAPNDLDIFDTSPPCSAFSNAGKGKKGWNKEKAYSGKKVQNIEDLFLEAVRIADGLKPKVIVAENVRGLTESTNREKLAEFDKAFESIGYLTTHEVLNAAHYGTPQSRERTIFICVRQDVADEIGLNFLNVHSIFPTGNPNDFVSTKAAIDDIVNDPKEHNKLLEFCAERWQHQWISQIPFNPSKHLKVSEFHPKKSLFNMIRVSPDLPCPTITQAGQKMNASGIFHYNYNRKLTIKELKRIQALPDDYRLTGSFDKQAERICRSHAPLQVKAIAESIYENVLQPYYEAINGTR